MRSPAIAPVTLKMAAPVVSRMVDSKRPLKRLPSGPGGCSAARCRCPTAPPADGGACWRMKRKNAVTPPPRTLFHAP